MSDVFTAVLSLEKTKSGLPGSFESRRQPTIRLTLKICASRSSVSLFPAPRMRDMTSERFFAVKTSDIRLVPRWLGREIYQQCKFTLEPQVKNSGREVGRNSPAVGLHNSSQAHTFLTCVRTS